MSWEKNQLGLEAVCTGPPSAGPRGFPAVLTQHCGSGAAKVEVRAPGAGSSRLWPRDWGPRRLNISKEWVLRLAKDTDGARWGNQGRRRSEAKGLRDREEQAEGAVKWGCQSIRRVGSPPRAAENSGEWTGASAKTPLRGSG